MPSGLDLLDGKAPVANAQSGNAKSGLELLDTAAPVAPVSIVPAKNEFSLSNPDAYDPLKIMGRIVPKELPQDSGGVWEGLVKPTLKAIPRVAIHTAASMQQMPISGAAALAKFISSGGDLDAANKVLEENQKALDDFYLTTPEERKGAENIGLAMKPFQMAGQGWKDIIGQTALGGTIAEPIVATIGEASAMFGLSKLGSVVKNRKGAVIPPAENTVPGTSGTPYSFEEFIKEADPIIEKAVELNKQQKIVENIPDEVLKSAQEKILEVQKTQLELEAKVLQDKIDRKKIAEEDLKAKGQEVQDIKDGKVEAEPEVTKTELPSFDSDKEMLKSLGYEEAEISVMKPEDVQRILSSEESVLVKSGIDILEPKTKPVTSGIELLNEAVNNLPQENIISENINNFVPKGKSKFLPALRVDGKIYSEGLNHGEVLNSIPSEIMDNAKNIESGYVNKKGKWFSEDEAKATLKLQPITDIDLQTGTPLPEKLKSANHPFRDKNAEHTNTMKTLLQEKVNNVDAPPEVFTRYLINEVNRYLNGEEVQIDKVRNGLSELAARADNLKTQFDMPDDFKAWRGTVQEAARWARESDRLMGKRTGGTQLNAGIDPTQIPEATRKIIEGAKALARYTAKARGMKEFKPGAAVQRIREELVRSGIDRSGNIRRELLDQLGNEGYEIIQKMYLSKGASSLAAQQLKQMRKEVYDGLSRDEKRILDNLILADRMLDIGKYKTTSQFKFPEGLSPVESAAYNELFQFVEELSPDKAELLKQRAQAYFEWMKKPLKDMLDAELITQEEFDALASHNYRRLKLVDVFDKRYQTKVGKTKRTVYDSGVEALSHGRDTDVFEPSSEVMALEVFNRAYGRILNNAANKSLLELARNDKDNPFVAVRETKTDRIPSGWDRVFVYEQGNRKAIYLSPDMAKEWITNSPEMSYKLSQFIRYASGSPILRTMATGIDWAFALANLPRDIMHIWYAARLFENGKWTPLYNSNMPAYAVQMGADISGIFHDAAMRKGKYLDYIKEGGGMEFLVHQGRLMQRGRHLEGNIDKVQDFLGYFGETSEIMTRLAIRDRVIKRRAAEQGISYEEAYKDPKVRQEATFAARDYMDFGQGGGLAKAIDNGLPYLNASIQGTRGLFRAFKDNPVQSVYKLSQFAALVTGIYIAYQANSPETAKALKGSLDMQSNIILPLGDGFGFDDEKGQRRYPYIKIPLDPSQKFFKMLFEACYDKATGQQVDAAGVGNALSQVSPAGISSLPPTLSGALGYTYNKDFWLNDDIWKKTDQPLSWPNSKEEYIPGKTPQAMIDAGAVTGLSPERLKYTLSSLVTGGSMWSWLVGQGYDAAFGDLPPVKKEMHLAEILSKTPIFRRFIGITNPYAQYAAPIDEAKEGSMMKRWIENRGLDQRVEAYLYEGGKRADVIEYITKTAKDQNTMERLRDRFVFQEKIKDLPNRSFWLALKGITDTEARAKVFVERFDKTSPEQQSQMNKEIGIVINAGGVISDEFKQQVMKVRDANARAKTTP